MCERNKEQEKVHFTGEQLEAIETRGCDLLVSAAAGSGKTAVLTERIVRMISEGEHPFDIDRILVVTFTRAAAAGMREKIAEALSVRAARFPDDRHLRRQEMLLPHAKIMTIDAFCQYVLRNNFDAAGLDPSFRVCDEGELKLLQTEVLEELLEEEYEKASGREDSDFLYCTEVYAQGATDRGIEEEITALYRFAESMPWPKLWLKTQLSGTSDKIPSGHDTGQPWLTELTKRLKKEFACAADTLRGVLRIIQSPGGPWMYEDTITSEIEKLSAAAKAADFSELYDAVTPVGGLFGRLSSKRDEAVETEKRETAKDIRNEIKDLIQKDIDRYFFAPPQILFLREQMAERASNELVRLALLYGERLENRKREKNVIDFSDMEHLALRVLVEEPEEMAGIFHPVPTAVAKEYAAYFHEIMIDEYQDSNYVQELILDAVSRRDAGERNRFMVGDVKQSIYRFRLARPEIFTGKLERCGRGPGEERRVDLHQNFRSRREVLDLANDVFSEVMKRDVGGVEYDDDAMLRAGADYPPPDEETDPFEPELLLYAKSEAESESDMEEEADPDDSHVSGEEAEARMIASRIRGLMKDGLVSDKKEGLRRPRFGDIVILLRATAGVDDVYREVLTEYGIPVHTESRAGYFKAREIRVLTDLLSIMENPLRDIPLAGVLRSVIGGFSDSELARIRAADPNRADGMYDALVRCASPDKNKITVDICPLSLSGKCADFLERLAAWREASGRLAVRELLEMILDETGYLELVSAMPAGARRRANVQQLMLRAAEFEKTGGRGLGAFAARLEQYRRVEVDYGEASVLSENADLVRIMSIHKSKGLEFPIVFVAGLSRAFNRRDERSAVLKDDRIGLGSYAVDPVERVRYTTLRRLAIADRMHEESLGEEYRVLYVAMTRAKEKLILTARAKEENIRVMMEAQQRLTGSAGLSYLKRAHASGYLSVLEAVLKARPLPIRIKMVTESGWKQSVEVEKKTEKERNRALTDAVNGININCYLKASILEKVRFQYAHKELENLYVKTTVTEMKEHSLAEEEEAPGLGHLLKEPEQSIKMDKNEHRLLRQGEKATGAERGILYHKVMELLDAEILYDQQITNQDLINENRNKVHEWMKKRKDEGLSPEAAEAVRPDDVLVFLSSDLGQRFIRAFGEKCLFREKQFMMSIDAVRVQKEAPAGEKVLLQGIIDAYFVEDNGIVLLDYKTDHTVGDGSELASRYGVQLQLYAEALERLTEWKVREKWIWSFAVGRAVRIP